MPETRIDQPSSTPAEHQSPEERSSHTQHLLQLSNAVVRIHKEYFGKGPTKARSYLSQDLLTVVLEGGFTRGEEKLHEHGNDAAVEQSRLAMQHMAESAFRSAVEEILTRKVRSFMSANDPAAGLQVEVFVLWPAGAEPREEDLADRARRVRDEHREVLDEHRALRAEQIQSRRQAKREREPGA